MKKSKVDKPVASKNGAQTHRSSSRSRDDTSKTRQKSVDERPPKIAERNTVADKSKRNAQANTGSTSKSTVHISNREKQSVINNADKLTRAPKPKPPLSTTSNADRNTKATTKTLVSSNLEKANKVTSKSTYVKSGQEKIQTVPAQTQKVKSNRPSQVFAGADKRLPVKALRLGNSPANLKPSKSSTNKTTAGDTNSKPNQMHDSKQENGESKRLGRERTRTRTINPEDSKLLTSLQEAAQQLPQDVENTQPAGVEDTGDDYEDDFENYESDFEDMSESQDNMGSGSSDDYSSSAVRKGSYDYDDITSSSNTEEEINDIQVTEVKDIKAVEEKKMDSGHYDLAENNRKSRKDSAYLEDIKLAIEKENTALRHLRTRPEPILRQDKIAPESFEAVNYVNFAQAKKRQQEKKTSHKLKKRGEVLLSMIRLDTVGFPLFEMAPVAYEVYMMSYGRSNTQQVSCQTNEDTMTEEVQTDDVDLKHKWTQHPPTMVQVSGISTPVKCAVASDPEDESMAVLFDALKIDAVGLEKFLLVAGQLMLNLLEEKSTGAQGLIRNNKFDLGFSQGFIILGTEAVPFLADRKVSHIRFIPGQPNSILTVHSAKEEVGSEAELSVQCVNRCMLCLWSLLQPSQPRKVLVSSADVVACCLHGTRPHLLFAGLSDGILSVWNLRERPVLENKIAFQGKTWSLRPPTYSTIDCIDSNHSAAVVSIQVLDSAVDSQSLGGDQSPTQICSLDESGWVLVWTLLRGVSDDAGVAPGGRLRLVLNASFSVPQQVAAVMTASLGTNLLFTDMAVDSQDPGHMYVSANTGHVVHCMSGGGRGHPGVFLPSWDCLARATCIAPCPFGLPYFLVGCSDGTVRLHIRSSNKPLLSVAGSGDAMGSGPEITCLQWSNQRPFVFFALDKLSRLHVWDLGTSDMYPLLTVPFKGKFITVAQLSSSSPTDKMNPFLALGTSCGKVKVHVVKPDLTSASAKETAIELDKFKRYVTIL